MAAVNASDRDWAGWWASLLNVHPKDRDPNPPPEYAMRRPLPLRPSWEELKQALASLVFVEAVFDFRGRVQPLKVKNLERCTSSPVIDASGSDALTTRFTIKDTSHRDSSGQLSAADVAYFRRLADSLVVLVRVAPQKAMDFGVVSLPHVCALIKNVSHRADDHAAISGIVSTSLFHELAAMDGWWGYATVGTTAVTQRMLHAINTLETGTTPLSYALLGQFAQAERTKGGTLCESVGLSEVRLEASLDDVCSAAKRRLYPQQKVAVCAAVSRKGISLIQGPPGTGKTEVIALTVAAVVHAFLQYAGRPPSILLTSASNVAIDNVGVRLLQLAEAVPSLGLGKLLLRAHAQEVSIAPALQDMSFSLLKDEGAHQRALLSQRTILMSTLAHVGSTTFASLSYDLVVVDEASQASDALVLIPLSRVAPEGSVVLVGDHKQLPPLLLSGFAKRFGLERSCFERLADCDEQRVVLLDRQHRMHPHIAEFPSRMFYRSRLTSGTSMERLRALPTLALSARGAVPWYGPLVFYDTAGLTMHSYGFGWEGARGSGAHERALGDSHTLANDGEAAIIAAIVSLLRSASLRPSPAAVSAGAEAAPLSVGVLSFYAGQVSVLTKCIAEGANGWNDGVEVNTVDGYQGREKGFIVISCVRSGKDVGFLRDPRRLNVALTRAQYGCVIVGDSATLRHDSLWRKLLALMYERGWVVPLAAVAARGARLADGDRGAAVSDEVATVFASRGDLSVQSEACRRAFAPHTLAVGAALRAVNPVGALITVMADADAVNVSCGKPPLTAHILATDIAVKHKVVATQADLDEVRALHEAAGGALPPGGSGVCRPSVAARVGVGSGGASVPLPHGSVLQASDNEAPSAGGEGQPSRPPSPSFKRDMEGRGCGGDGAEVGGDGAGVDGDAVVGGDSSSPAPFCGESANDCANSAREAAGERGASGECCSLDAKEVAQEGPEDVSEGGCGGGDGDVVGDVMMQNGVGEVGRDGDDGGLTGATGGTYGEGAPSVHAEGVAGEAPGDAVGGDDVPAAGGRRDRDEVVEGEGMSVTRQGVQCYTNDISVEVVNGDAEGGGVGVGLCVDGSQKCHPMTENSRDGEGGGGDDDAAVDEEGDNIAGNGADEGTDIATRPAKRRRGITFGDTVRVARYCAHDHTSPVVEIEPTTTNFDWRPQPCPPPRDTQPPHPDDESSPTAPTAAAAAVTPALPAFELSPSLKDSGAAKGKDVGSPSAGLSGLPPEVRRPSPPSLPAPRLPSAVPYPSAAAASASAGGIAAHKAPPMPRRAPLPPPSAGGPSVGEAAVVCLAALPLFDPYCTTPLPLILAKGLVELSHNPALPTLPKGIVPLPHGIAASAVRRFRLVVDPGFHDVPCLAVAPLSRGGEVRVLVPVAGSKVPTPPSRAVVVERVAVVGLARRYASIWWVGGLTASLYVERETTPKGGVSSFPQRLPQVSDLPPPPVWWPEAVAAAAGVARGTTSGGDAVTKVLRLPPHVVTTVVGSDVRAAAVAAIDGEALKPTKLASSSKFGSGSVVRHGSARPTLQPPPGPDTTTLLPKQTASTSSTTLPPKSAAPPLRSPKASRASASAQLVVKTQPKASHPRPSSPTSPSTFSAPSSGRLTGSTATTADHSSPPTTPRSSPAELSQPRFSPLPSGPSSHVPSSNPLLITHPPLTSRRGVGTALPPGLERGIAARRSKSPPPPTRHTYTTDSDSSSEEGRDDRECATNLSASGASSLRSLIKPFALVAGASAQTPPARSELPQWHNFSEGSASRSGAAPSFLPRKGTLGESVWRTTIRDPKGPDGGSEGCRSSRESSPPCDVPPSAEVRGGTLTLQPTVDDGVAPPVRSSEGLVARRVGAPPLSTGAEGVGDDHVQNLVVQSSTVSSVPVVRAAPAQSAPQTLSPFALGHRPIASQLSFGASVGGVKRFRRANAFQSVDQPAPKVTPPPTRTPTPPPPRTWTPPRLDSSVVVVDSESE